MCVYVCSVGICEGERERERTSIGFGKFSSYKRGCHKNLLIKKVFFGKSYFESNKIYLDTMGKNSTKPG